MEYYLSPGATRFYTGLIDEAISIVDRQLQSGMLQTLFRQVRLGSSYDPYEHLDLPVFFVIDEDLGKDMSVADWHIVTRRNHDATCAVATVIPRPWMSPVEKELEPATNCQGFNDEKALNLPDTVHIPEAGEFGCQHRADIIESILDALAEPNSPFNPNLRVEFNPAELFGSLDWLGLYRGFRASQRCIIIRIDKITEERFLADCGWYGVATIVFHEIGHAIMDTRNKPTLRFSTMVRPEYVDVIYYVLEEALANLIAYRGIRSRGMKKNDSTVITIAQFMANQPFPYSLGLKIGQATPMGGGSATIDADIMKYIRVWYLIKAEPSYTIRDIHAWARLIRKKAFNADDLKQQCHALSDTKEIADIKPETEHEADGKERRRAGKKRKQVSTADLLPKWNGEHEGFIDSDGNWVIPPIFDKAYPFDDAGMARVVVGGMTGWIGLHGEWIIRPAFSRADEFHEDLACVLTCGLSGKKFGFINRRGEWVLDPIYELADSFSEGLAAVSVNGSEFGYIDHDGNWIIKPIYSCARSFSGGSAFVQSNNGLYLWGLIDKSGKELHEPKFDEVWDFNEKGYARVMISNSSHKVFKWINRKGKEFDFIK